MPTHAEIAGKLLRDAAEFFRSVAEENPEIGRKLNESAVTFENVATLVEQDPTGVLPDSDLEH